MNPWTIAICVILFLFAVPLGILLILFWRAPKIEPHPDPNEESFRSRMKGE